MPFNRCCQPCLSTRSLSAAPAVLFTLSFLAVPGWSCTTPPGQVASAPGSNTFFYNFATPTNSNFSTYAIQIPAVSGQNAAGDRNSSYFPLYYSISNLNAWMAANGYCPIELIVVGAFPDVPYFSITDNDMHYTAAQHLADLDIDPANSSISNPFVVGASGLSPAYNGSQYYLVPISLGSVPNISGGCQIQPFEEDNLLDATQRHLSMDWNTSVGGASVNSGLDAHAVDPPDHTNPNLAGSIVIRGYLAPIESCHGSLGSISCSEPNDPKNTPPYFIVRDVQTGCPYLASYVTQYLLNTAPVNSGTTCTTGPKCNAIFSTTDRSAISGVWLDQTQQSQHTWANNTTPQTCYANGDPQYSPPYPNQVPWVRSPEWNGTPGPDDSYIGGGVSKNDLTGLVSGSKCNGGSGNGCVIRLRFKLPPNTPSTPCPQTPPNDAPCKLNGSASLRYMSLTLWQQQPLPGGTAQNYYTADPDGIAANPNGVKPVSMMSLADAAFTVANGYVTLLVGVGATLPSWLGQASMSSAVTQGVQPVTVHPSATNPSISNYSAWTVNGYNVVNLSQFAGVVGEPAFDTGYPLLITIRNTLPDPGFNCSGSQVPFFTAEYTRGGGMMGPYVPLVDFVDPNDTTTLPHTGPGATSGLPPTSACGLLPQKVPAGNGPLSLNTSGDCGSGSNCVLWPNQSWPGVTGGASPPLACSGANPNSPVIDFVATQFPVPVDANTTLYPTSPQGCNSSYLSQTTPCSQIIYQTPQSSGVSSGTLPPPLPIALVGTGFGYLPNLPQTMASCTTSCASNYLEIVNDGNSGLDAGWDTSSGASCQMYIANWTDTMISLVANLPISTTDLYFTSNSILGFLSPLADVSPLTFMPSPTGQNTFACPVWYNTNPLVMKGDKLTFNVTNPQSSTTVNITWEVSAPGTTLH